MKNKLNFSIGIFVLLAGIVLSKAFYVQVLNAKKLNAYSEKQSFRQKKVEPNRGKILDRNGNQLVVNKVTYNLAINAKNLSKSDIKKQVKNVVKIIKKKNTWKVTNRVIKRRKFTYLYRNIELSTQQVEKLKKLKWITLDRNITRYYPNHELASQLLGFVNVDNRGISGIEYQFNKELSGEASYVTYYRDAKGRTLRKETKAASVQSHDVTLSIDKNIQAIAEKYLKEGVLRHKAKSGGVGIIDAKNGEILAIANYPSFDPNSVSKSKPQHRRLSIVTDPIEPGSIFKLVTVASALKYGVVKPKTLIDCENGRMKIGKHEIGESDNHKYKKISVKEIIEKSSNIGTTKIAFKLGYEKFKSTLLRYKIGQKTGIEFPSESKGIFDIGQKSIRKIRLSNISFGQGIATNGIQTLLFYASIANGGYYIRPSLLKQKEVKAEQILTKQVTQQLEEMLRGVVVDGTGSNAEIPGFDIVGKTGTAQKPDARGGYDGYIPSFVGYPAKLKNRFVVFVYVDEPKENGRHGNEVAAPIFRKITEQILLYRDEAPTAEKKSILGQVAGHKQEDKVQNIQSSVKRSQGPGRMPLFIGLDRRASREMAKKMKIEIELQGIGVVKSQFPKAGTTIEKSTRVRLKLATPRYESI